MSYTFTKKLHGIGNFAKKFRNSHEYSFAKKLINHPKRHIHKARQFIDHGGLTDPATYIGISRTLNKFNQKGLKKYKDLYENLSEETNVDNPFPAIERGLRIGVAASKGIGRTLQNVKTKKGKLEKGASIVHGAMNTFRDIQGSY